MALKAQVSSFATLLGDPADNAALQADLDSASLQVVSTSINYSVIDDSKNYVIYVDTTSAPVTVTLSGTSRRTIKIVDAGENAGTNIITIAGTIDGVTNATIEADGGSHEVSYSGTAWESSGGFNQFFQRDAATGVISTKSPDILLANMIKGGEESTTFQGVLADFSQAEANVDQGVSGWGNVDVSSDISSGIAWDTATTFIHNATSVTLSDTQDDLFMSQTVSASLPNGGEFWIGSGAVTLDFGTAQPFARILFGRPVSGNYAVDFYFSAITVQGSNDNSNWTQLFTGSGKTAPISAVGATAEYALDVTGSYRYIKLLGGNGQQRLGCMALFANVPATTTNTFQYRPLTGGSSTAFAPSTLVAYDETSAQLVNGDLLIEYSLDQGSTWPGGQRSLTDFKALGALTGTNFWLRFEMVGAKLLSEVEITTASSFATADSGGLDVVVDGSTIGGITPDGVRLPSLTGTARDAISAPVEGLLIFNTTSNKLNFYTGAGWEVVTSAAV